MDQLNNKIRCEIQQSGKPQKQNIKTLHVTKTKATHYSPFLNYRR